MNLNKTKSLFKSRGVLGGAGATLLGFIGIFGYAVTPEDVQSLYQLSLSIGTSVCGIIAIIGRIKATLAIG